MVARTDRWASSMSEGIGASGKIAISLFITSFAYRFYPPQSGVSFTLPPRWQSPENPAERGVETPVGGNSGDPSFQNAI